MYTIVTGAAGFIGSNLVKALNNRGVKKIIAVDNLTRADKFKNLVDCEIVDYLDKEEFIARLSSGQFDGKVDAIFHEGACSDTMETDGRYMMENNFRYSLQLLDWCIAQKVQFLYASSAATYGGSSVFREEREFEAPLNVYGYSKFLFDQIVRQRLLEAKGTTRRSSVSAISTSMARASRTKGAWPLWLSTTTTSSAPTTRSSCSRAVMATRMASRSAISSTSAMWRKLTSFSSIIRRLPGYST